jgi:hypothetical protein
MASMLPASAAAAESPQLYVGSGNGYLIVFKVEAGRTYVLGLDTTVYCVSLEPWEPSKPTLNAFFPEPKVMKERPDGLVATEEGGDVFSSRGLTVHAAFDGDKLVGSFVYAVSEFSYHCQTAGYYGTRPEVPFQAVRYEPVDGSAPVPPLVNGTPAVYYGTEGPLETYFSVFPKEFGMRGTVLSGCLAGVKKRPTRRGPISSELQIASFGDDGTFRDRLHSLGPHGITAIKEAIGIAGIVGGETITGTYFDRIVTRLGKKRKRICHTGPLPFRAQRYLPATP